MCEAAVQALMEGLGLTAAVICGAWVATTFFKAAGGKYGS